MKNLFIFLYSTVIAWVLWSSDFCDCAKILNIFHLPLQSHFTYDNAIARSLSNAGHEITMITSFADVAAQENYSKVIDTSIEAFVGKESYEEFKKSSRIEQITFFVVMQKHYCDKLLETKEYREFLNSNITFDVVFVEIHYVTKCLLPIIQKLKVPVIGVTSHMSWLQLDRIINNVNHPADVPYEVTYGWGNTFCSRLKNTWFYIFDTYVRYFYIYPVETRLYRESVQQLVLDSDFLGIEPNLVFYNSHHSILPRPMNPNAIEIGGIQVPPAKPLPENIQKFIEEGNSGTILCSFGSVIKTSGLPQETIVKFMNVFSRLPLRVIWKFEDEIKNLSSNVMPMKWLPQRDILEHHNVIAFISHCGIGSMYEAISTVTPVVAIPVLADQHVNAAILENSGVAIQLDIDSISEEGILSAIDVIINDIKYSDNMRKLSDAFKDRPMTPEQTVVYWTEYVIRHKGASKLKTPSSQLNWFQYFLLDISCFVTISSICIIYSVYWLVVKGIVLVEYICRCMRKNKLHVE